MTEGDWPACEDPERMPGFLRDRGGDRKVRLFVTALCRWRWHHLADERSRRAVTVAERFADGLAGDRELRQAAHQAAQAREASWSERGLYAAGNCSSAKITSSSSDSRNSCDTCAP